MLKIENYGRFLFESGKAKEYRNNHKSQQITLVKAINHVNKLSQRVKKSQRFRFPKHLCMSWKEGGKKAICCRLQTFENSNIYARHANNREGFL